MNKVIALLLVIWAFFIGSISYHDERSDHHENGVLNSAEDFVLMETSEG